MASRVTIEDIETRRCQQGIDDVELREAVRRLRAGDHVRLTLLSGPDADVGETVLVRITSVRRGAFRGCLEKKPRRSGLAHLRRGSALDFNANHVHSLAPSGTANGS